MPGEARDGESSTAAESYPIITRSYEPVADLDDRVERIFAVLSLPPPEDFSAPGPSLARSATRVGMCPLRRRRGRPGTSAGGAPARRHSTAAARVAYRSGHANLRCLLRRHAHTDPAARNRARSRPVRRDARERARLDHRWADGDGGSAHARRASGARVVCGDDRRRRQTDDRRADPDARTSCATCR
jgi:hypothetical protein